MARLIATLDAPVVALSAATAKTIALLTAPVNQCLGIKEIRVTLDGATSTATPVKVETGRPTTAGTFTAAVPGKKDPGRSETVQATGGINASLEPTWPSPVLDTAYIPAYGGVYHYIAPFDNPIVVPGTGRFGIRCTAPAAVNCSAKIDYEE